MSLRNSAARADADSLPRLDSPIGLAHLGRSEEAPSSSTIGREWLPTGTLNHLTSSSPLQELTELVRDQTQMTDRLRRSLNTRAQLETQLLVAGVSAEQIDAAIRAGRVAVG
jgi:hypothetical protein